MLIEHHVKRFREHFADYVSEQDIVNKSILIVEENKYRKAIWDGLAYPGLDDPEKFQKSVDAHIKAVNALQSGNFIQVPDFDERGKINLDCLCEGCVNPQPGLGYQCKLYDDEEAYLDL